MFGVSSLINNSVFDPDCPTFPVGVTSNEFGEFGDLLYSSLKKGSV